LHDYESIYSGCDIVEHDSCAFWQSFQLSDGRRLEDVEDSKKYKTSKKSFPFERNGDERDKLSGYLVDDNEAGIFPGRGPGDAGCGGNTHKGDDGRETDKDRCAHRIWQGVGESGPEEHGHG
jgi:hypothetical protein